MSRSIFNQERTGRTEIVWNAIEEEYGYWKDGLFYAVEVGEEE